MISKEQLYLSVRPLVRFVKFRILHVDDSPKRIALGVSVGLFVAWSPLYGFHLLLSLILATALKANKLVAMLCVWISNAFTLIPIYYPNYLLGSMITGWFRHEGDLSRAEVIEFINKLFSPKSILMDIFTLHFWKDFVSFFLKIGLELTIGGTIIGLALAIIAYFLTFCGIETYRRNHPHKRYRKHTEII